MDKKTLNEWHLLRRLSAMAGRQGKAGGIAEDGTMWVVETSVPHTDDGLGPITGCWSSRPIVEKADGVYPLDSEGEG